MLLFASYNFIYMYMNIKIWTLELRSQRPQCLHLHLVWIQCIYYSVYTFYNNVVQQFLKHLFIVGSLAEFFFFTNLLNFPLLVPLNRLFCYGQAVLHD